MMTKRLIAVGNSAALIIDKPILEMLEVGMETDLNIRMDGRTLVISAAKVQNDRVQAAQARVIARHGKTFRKLAGKSGK